MIADSVRLFIRKKEWKYSNATHSLEIGIFRFKLKNASNWNINIDLKHKIYIFIVMLILAEIQKLEMYEKKTRFLQSISKIERAYL